MNVHEPSRPDARNRLLPPDILVLERGWLSSNSVVLLGKDSAAIVDTGYWTHAEQTLALVAAACGDVPLRTLVNTHLHSDHCGGNAALQARYPSVHTWVPAGVAPFVRQWDPVALTYTPTGQHCPRFALTDILVPGGRVQLADRAWEVHGAPGHDPHSVVLFEPESRTLISADALWENGFGVVFPELEGGEAFAEVGATLDRIEALAPAVVIPGHGTVFTDVAGALERARRRLAAYIADPRRHAAHAAKVLLKFKLLELRSEPLPEFLAWAQRTPYFALVHAQWFGATEMRSWILGLLQDLERSGAVRIESGLVRNG